MPQAPEYKTPTAAEVRKASKNLAPNINETFMHKGKRISAWIKDKTKPITSRTGTIGYERKLHPEFRKQKQATVKTTEDKKEDKTVTTDTTDKGKKIREILSSAVGRKAAGERAAAKIFDTDRASIARGKRAREKVFSRATPEAATEAGSERARIAGARAARRLYEAAGKNIDPRVATEPVKVKRLIDPTIDYEDTRAGLDEGFYKKGGKVSRKKSKKGKKASWNGNNEVSRWYD
jgi:hypothetical protein